MPVPSLRSSAHLLRLVCADTAIYRLSGLEGLGRGDPEADFVTRDVFTTGGW